MLGEVSPLIEPKEKTKGSAGDRLKMVETGERVKGKTFVKCLNVWTLKGKNEAGCTGKLELPCIYTRFFGLSHVRLFWPCVLWPQSSLSSRFPSQGYWNEFAISPLQRVITTRR